LNTIEPILTQTDTSGRWRKGMKRSTVGSGGQRSRSQDSKDKLGGLAKVSF